MLSDHVKKFFESNNPEFMEACSRAEIEQTRRQASKWLLKKGKAWKNRKMKGEES